MNTERHHFIVIQSLSHVWLFATPWTAVRQASLSFTISQSLLKFMSIESTMPSNHLILCCPFSSCPQSFPESGSFPMCQFFASGGQSIGALASVLPVNIQGWFPLGLTGSISLLLGGGPHSSSKAIREPPPPPDEFGQLKSHVSLERDLP